MRFLDDSCEQISYRHLINFLEKKLFPGQTFKNRKHTNTSISFKLIKVFGDARVPLNIHYI